MDNNTLQSFLSTLLDPNYFRHANALQKSLSEGKMGESPLPQSASQSRTSSPLTSPLGTPLQRQNQPITISPRESQQISDPLSLSSLSLNEPTQQTDFLSSIKTDAPQTKNTQPLLSDEDFQNFADSLEEMDSLSSESLSQIFRAPFNNKNLDIEDSLKVQSGLSDFLEAGSFSEYLSEEERGAQGFLGLQTFLSAVDSPQKITQPLLENQKISAEDSALFKKSYNTLKQGVNFLEDNTEKTLSPSSPEDKEELTMMTAALGVQQRNYTARTHLFPQANITEGMIGLKALRNALGGVSDARFSLPTTTESEGSNWELPNGQFLKDSLHGTLYQALRSHLQRTPLSLLHQPDNALYTHRLLSSLGSSLQNQQSENLFSFQA